MRRSMILFIIALALLLGGAVRLFANEAIFRIFLMDHLWFGEPFARYNYRLLAVFVLWMGVILAVCSRDVVRYKGVIRASILGLLMFFVVSLLAGLATGLETRFFLVDSIFSLILAALLYIIQKE